MKKLLVLFVAVLLAAAAVTGCAPKSKETSAAESLVINVDRKEVKVLAEVNGKYFTEATRHGVVFKGGSNGEKSVLRALPSEKDFYEALNSFGLQAGNNLTKDDKNKGKMIEGDELQVYVTWEGLDKEIPFNDIIVSSDPRPMVVRFGGNIDRANSANTGCILCLDSCPVGITSNSSYAFGESDTIQFTGNKEVLPADGTRVTVIFRAE